jgi:hypothetical protein
LLLALAGLLLAIYLLARGWGPSQPATPPETHAVMDREADTPKDKEGPQKATIPESAAWAWAGPRFTVADSALAVWLAQSTNIPPQEKASPKQPAREDHPIEKPGHASAHAHPPSGALHPGHWELIFYSLLLIGGGLLIGYCERQAHEALARQYDSMYVVFKRGAHELDFYLDRPVPDLDGARKVIEALGREALVEHVQWLINRRVRPFELVLGG